MILPWRRKRRGRAAAATELTVPTDFRCPISLDLMKDPVTLSTGITYDRASIETWIIDQGHDTCPVTKRVLPALDPVPNHAIRRMIQDWCVEKKSYGVERIPTPRAPLSSLEASDLLARLESSSTPRIANPIVARILNKARESERNRRVILSHGGSRVVSSKFEEFAKNDDNGVVLDELLACLALLSPALHVLKAASLKRVVWVLKNGDLASKQHAVSVLKEAVTSRAAELESECALEGLVSSVKDPVSPQSLKDSLYTIYHILKARSGPGPGPVNDVVELGLISLVVEIAVGSDKSLCEMALGVLDEVCREARGRVTARGNAMTVPVVVKKMLRVSDLATEFSVSVLWRLSREEDGGAVLGEALEVGAFQKLLLVLQVGFSGSEDGATKEKVTELLKRLNVFQRETGRLECVESMDFKDLKRSF